MAPTVTIQYPSEGFVSAQDVVPAATVTDALDPNPSVSLTPTPPFVIEGAYQFSVTATDWAGNSATATRSFVIDKTAPTITFDFPSEGHLTNQPVVPVYGVTDSLDPSPVVAMTPSPPYTSEGSYQVILTATDWAGNQSQVTRSFAIDLTVPVIWALTPVPDSATANAQATISASFS